MSIKLSSFQSSIENFVVSGKGNGFVEAVAGSGKTFTLVNVVAPKIKGKACFLAFDKSIATELGAKLKDKGVDCKTLHSLGFAALRYKLKRVRVENRKYRYLMDDRLDNYLPNDLQEPVEQGLDLRTATLKLVDLARVNMVDYTNHETLMDLCDHYQIELPDIGQDFIFESVADLIDTGIKNVSTIDFTDMIYLPASQNEYSVMKYDWVLVDEAQDLNKCQRELVRQAGKRGTRYIFVGDGNQAIYGFAGADHRSFEAIKDEFKAKSLPLSICYRCPESHLELAKQIVPQIEAAPGAEIGVVNHFTRDKLEPQEGDLIMCRTNAPLVTLCFQLLAQGLPARIKGRDIGYSLISTAKKISSAKKFGGWSRFGDEVFNWEYKEVSRLERRKADDTAIQAVQDRAECLRIIWSTSEAGSLKDFKTAVEDIFSDDRPGIQLSSIHRAKGLEADNTFILRPDLLPGPWANPGSWQYQQEMNLKYVALTRSLKTLTFITD